MPAEPKLPKLSIKDPVSPEVLRNLSRIMGSRQQVAETLLNMELEKIPLIVAARTLDEEKGRLFARELEARGISSETQVTIDGTTGVIELVMPDIPSEE
jgi:hypothetical protein